jgi:hypothetical protein
MADDILSEILSFLNPARKAPGYFPVEQNRQTLGLGPALSRVQEKTRPLAAGETKLTGFWQDHPVHAPTPHRAGSPSPVRVGVVVPSNPTHAGAHHDIQKNRR